MVSCAFIDNGFHEKTRSSEFFKAELLKDFDVDKFSIETASANILVESADRQYDYYVCYQTEFAAPYLLSRGCKVICVPMWDGVAGLPDIYWLGMKEARFIAFSAALYHRLLKLGFNVRRAQYFPYPFQWPTARFDDGFRPFFWIRRPSENLSWRFAAQLIGGIADTLHIHNAPDNPAEYDDAFEAEDFGVTVSSWSQTAAEYVAALDRANIFIAPRHAEGIGMSFLEALARGMYVIGPNTSTFTDYVVNGWNGSVIDYWSPRSFEHLDTKRIPARARVVAERGYERWMRSVDDLRQFIIDCSIPRYTNIDNGDRNAVFEVARRSIPGPVNGLPLKNLARPVSAYLSGADVRLWRKVRWTCRKVLYPVWPW